jgi:hypothetical protein
LGDGVTNLPNYIVDEDEYRELLNEQYRLKSTIKTLRNALDTIVNGECYSLDAAWAIAREALDDQK